MTWTIDDTIGAAVFEELITEFYERLYSDMMIGFFFLPHEKSKLITSQMAWLRSNLGDRSGSYDGKNIREAHGQLPILVGHFDRRHQILKELLHEFSVDQQVTNDWLELDASLRPMVVKQGSEVRDKILNAEPE